MDTRAPVSSALSRNRATSRGSLICGLWNPDRGPLARTTGPNRSTLPPACPYGELDRRSPGREAPEERRSLRAAGWCRRRRIRGVLRCFPARRASRGRVRRWPRPPRSRGFPGWPIAGRPGWRRLPRRAVSLRSRSSVACWACSVSSRAGALGRVRHAVRAGLGCGYSGSVVRVRVLRPIRASARSGRAAPASLSRPG